MGNGDVCAGLVSAELVEHFTLGKRGERALLSEPFHNLVGTILQGVIKKKVIKHRCRGESDKKN